MAKRKRKMNPNRFKQPISQSFFSFDVIRQRVLIWGFVAGTLGGFFMIRPEFVWQVIGVLIVVLVSNYHIAQAAKSIPRWHATAFSLAGAMLGIFGIFIIVITFFGAPNPAGG